MSRQLFVSPASPFPSAFRVALRRTAVAVAEAVSSKVRNGFARGILPFWNQFRVARVLAVLFLMASAYGSSGRHRSCPQPIHLRAVAAETQGVIAVRAHFPAISKPRRMLSASVTDVTFSATTPAGLALRLARGWGHLTSSTRILIRRSDRRGHTPCVRLRTRGARRGMRKQEGVLPKSRDDVQRAQHPAEAVDVTASVGT
jgi:hypothetical protein